MHYVSVIGYTRPGALKRDCFGRRKININMRAVDSNRRPVRVFGGVSTREKKLLQQNIYHPIHKCTRLT